MPSILTHLNFIDEEHKSNANLKKLDLGLMKLGSIFPDIDYYVPKRKIKMLHFMHHNYQLGIDFSKELLNNAKTKEEVSFAIGFLSHFIIDKEVHLYLETETNPQEHLLIEFFIDSRYAFEKYPTGKFPKDLFRRTIITKHKNYIKDLKKINWIHLQAYKIIFYMYKSLIISRFIKTRTKWYHKLLAILPGNQKESGIKIKHALKGRLDKEKVKIVEDEINISKLIFDKEINTYFKRKPNK